MALGAHPSRVTVTSLGCDHIARDLPPEGFGDPRDPYIFTVSRVDARKNHLRMLEAFEMLVKEGLPHRWIIAGLGVRGTSGAVDLTGCLLRLVQSGNLQTYALLLALGLLVMLTFFLF